jgi:histidyl-tRNA synthetase
MEMIQAVRGTRDILPQEVRLWQQVEASAREILGRANYQEIRTPILELTELFARSIGSATDVVGKEMYSFSTRGEQEVSLRPENTAGVVRAYIQHGLQMAGDVQRLWYCGPMFRYERLRRAATPVPSVGGRAAGQPGSPRRCGSHRLGLGAVASGGGGEPELAAQFPGDLQDRRAYRQALVDYLTPLREKLDPDSQERLTRNPLRILDSKDPRTREIAEGAPKLPDYLGPESRAFFEQVQAHLQMLDIPYQLDPYLVRGLDYYTDTAFEIVSPDLGSQSTVCGGGRYDGLVEELGGPSTPAVGWAVGMERLVLLLQKKQGEAPPAPVEVYVISRGAKAEAQSLRIAQALRQAGFCTELDLSGSAFGKQFKRASRSGATWAVVLGDAEAAAGEVQLKHLPTGQQQTLLQADLIQYLACHSRQQCGAPR